MLIPASTILIFVTGLLYSDQPRTILFSDMLCEAMGKERIETLHLLEAKRDYAPKILAQLPADFKKTCEEWRHTQDWRERVQMVDEAFGLIEIKCCA